MILILLSWIYIFFTTATSGIVFSKALRIQQQNIVTTVFLGLFSVTVFTTIWAFFGPVSIVFHCVLLILSILSWYNNKEDFSSVTQNVKNEIRLLSFPVSILLAISSLLILMQSSAPPFIIDNESYYIQTIKWLNEYGFVKGLANLHLFLGQTSGWHIAQSAYSLSFLYDRFNDLNGFCLLLVNFFAFLKLDSYFKDGNYFDLTFGLLPLTYIFLFQFISAPSPDLAVYLLTFILLSTYLQNENKTERFTIISILALFAVFVKVTAVVLLLFPLVSLINDFRVLKKQFATIFLLGSLVLILFVSKNTILTGYPLFPLLCFRVNFLDYAVPEIIMDFFFSKSMLYSFYIPNSDFDSLSVFDMAKRYFFNNGITGYIGIFSVLLLVVSPFVIIRKRMLRTIWTVYFAFIILTVLLCFSSPQYRFYVHFSLFFMLLLASLMITRPRWILRFSSASLMLTTVFLLIPISYGSLTENKFLGQNSTFSFRNIIVPEPNSKWKPEFRGGSVGNMHFHSPLDTSFFWVTGEGKLPCINTVQLDYFRQGFYYIPQQRSIDLKDGFYSQKVSGNE